jgi:hypothetical protein
MANEEKLLELLRRAHTVLGEGLIENALDRSAAGRSGSLLVAAWNVSVGRIRRRSAPSAATRGATSTMTLASRSTTGAHSARSARPKARMSHDGHEEAMGSVQ